MSQNASETEDRTVYRVVVNLEEQYSIWPDGQPPPPGWTAAETSGSKAECLAAIKATWRDMRPASLRRAMAELARPGARPVAPGERSARQDLVAVLADGDHPVELGLRPRRSAQALSSAIDHGVVHVKFTTTRGGTELGIPLDRARCDVRGADFQRATGTIHLEGELTVDLVRVRCVIDVDLATLAGAGHLVNLGTAWPGRHGGQP